MDLERLQQYVDERGIPTESAEIITGMQEAFGVDVTPIISPPRPNRSNYAGVTPFNNRDAVSRAYRNLRAATRNSMHETINHSVEGLMFIDRNSSPRNIVHRYTQAFWDYFGTEFRRGNTFDNPSSFGLPLVFDCNSRIDYAPAEMPDALERHCRVQMITRSQEFRRFVATGSLNGHNFYTEMSSLDRDWDPEVSAELLEVHGWVPVYSEPLADHGELGHVLVGAHLPVEVDPHGEHLIFLMTPVSSSQIGYMSPALAGLMKCISNRWPSGAQAQQGLAQEYNDLAVQLRALMGLRANSMRRLTDLSSQIAGHSRDAEMFTADLAGALRLIETKSEEKAALERDAASTIMARYRETYEVAETIAAMRPIESAEMNADGMLVARTHPFGMTSPNYDGIVLIPSLEYSINTASDHFQRGISIAATEGENEGIHPHLSGGPCWGEAGRHLAEAWARRDWSSLMRLMLGWHTQYNDHSPHYSWSHFINNEFTTDRRGWHVPEPVVEPEPEPEVVDETVDLVGNAEPASDLRARIAASREAHIAATQSSPTPEGQPA